jgi:hypothetical protein
MAEVIWLHERKRQALCGLAHSSCLPDRPLPQLRRKNDMGLEALIHEIFDESRNCAQTHANIHRITRFLTSSLLF